MNCIFTIIWKNWFKNDQLFNFSETLVSYQFPNVVLWTYICSFHFISSWYQISSLEISRLGWKLDNKKIIANINLLNLRSKATARTNYLFIVSNILSVTPSQTYPSPNSKFWDIRSSSFQNSRISLIVGTYSSYFEDNEWLFYKFWVYRMKALRKLTENKQCLLSTTFRIGPICWLWAKVNIFKVVEYLIESTNKYIAIWKLP